MNAEANNIKSPKEQRYLITQMIESMTDAQMDEAIALLREQLFDEVSAP